MIIDTSVRAAASDSVRARQVAGMFDVPTRAEQRRSWKLDAPIEDRPWNAGLIVGPSGSGKSTILKQFGTPVELSWGAPSVIDDFAAGLNTRQITEACGAVGFNTIPAWLRPYATLSNGEQFRAGLARVLAEADGLVVIDEFTSVVDRQVAKIASHALAQYARRTGRQVVVASCHYDVIDWLRPDWMIEPADQTFQWRAVGDRPKLRPSSQPATQRCGGGSLPITI